MDNLSKALYMATGLLLFIMAMTSSIILYNQIIEYANASLVISDMGNRAEFASSEEYIETKRTITRAEVITSIMQKDSLYVDEILVNGSVKDIKNIEEGTYKVEYIMDDTDGRISEIRYEKEEG